VITDITPPATEPVSLEGAKLFLRLDHDEEDDLIVDLIQQARERIESLCGRSLIRRARRMTFTPPLKRTLYLKMAPIETVTSITLHLEDGIDESLDLSSLAINLRATPASLKAKTLKLFDFHNRSDVQAISVDVIAGYGDSPEDIPMPLRQAMLLLIGQAYETRSGGELPAIPMMVDALIMPYRSLKL
jgi:uncharacterized phiE125 gp8 family phage protein